MGAQETAGLPEISLALSLPPPTLLERYKTLNFEYIVYCKYSPIRSIYREWI